MPVMLKWQKDKFKIILIYIVRFEASLSCSRHVEDVVCVCECMLTCVSSGVCGSQRWTSQLFLSMVGLID